MPPRFEDDDDLPPKPGSSSNTALWIVLAVVGGITLAVITPFVLCCGIGMVGFKSASLGPPPNPALVSGSAEEDPVEFGDEANTGDVSVKVLSAKIGRVPTQAPGGKAGLSDREYLLITVEVKNLNPVPIAFTPWYNAATCTDDAGNTCLPTDITDARGQRLKILGQQDQPTNVAAGKTLRDNLVLEQPAPGMKHVILSLPATSVGGTGALWFRIRVEDIQK
jgi:hypothetical protein